MSTLRRHSVNRAAAVGPLYVCLACLLVLAAYGRVATASEPGATPEELQAVLDGGIPDTLAKLRAMQVHVQQLTDQVSASTVAVQVGVAQGSGVIISEDGYVLTAAHVSGAPGRTAWMVLPDGTRVRGETLGQYRTIDAGLIKIRQSPADGKWPHALMGKSDEVALGQWCLAVGHPGGFEESRPPIVRLGRVLSIQEDGTMTTDCTLIGGDSGGPLFDMNGKVIGINSRIGNPLTVNLHVPINAYREDWDRLTQGDTWGHTPGQTPFIGVQGKPGAEDATIHRVFPGTPAEKAGLEPGDVVLRFNGSPIKDFAALQSLVSEQVPGTQIKLIVQRGSQTLQLPLVIGRRSD